MTNKPKDMAASVQARLNNLARDQGRTYQELLQYYAIERFLYRLSQSPYRNRFALKGGVVFFAWGIPLRRPTRDIDLHGRLPDDVAQIEEIIKSVCLQNVISDGMVFDENSIQSEVIQGGIEQAGARIRFIGYLGSTRISMRIDIGFADIVVPPAIELNYPSLLDMPEPNLSAYTYETVIAEKFQAMVFLGTINSRMKDFHDIWLLSTTTNIDGSSLYDAIVTTFKSRGTKIPHETPIALTPTFALSKQRDWQAFINRTNINDTVPSDFGEVIKQLHDFLMLVLDASQEETGFPVQWSPDKNSWQ